MAARQSSIIAHEDCILILLIKIIRIVRTSIYKLLLKEDRRDTSDFY